MKLRLNIWKMGLGLLASLTLAASLAVLVLLGTGWGNDQVRRAVVRNVQDRLNGQVTIERVETGLRTHLAMQGVSLRLADVQGGMEVAGADEIRIDFNVWDAVVGDAPPFSVGIDGFRMAYVEDAAGTGMNSLDLLFEGPAQDGEAAGSGDQAGSGSGRNQAAAGIRPAAEKRHRTAHRMGKRPACPSICATCGSGTARSATSIPGIPRR